MKARVLLLIVLIGTGLVLAATTGNPLTLIPTALLIVSCASSIRSRRRRN